jgi:hypothetical protein
VSNEARIVETRRTYPGTRWEWLRSLFDVLVHLLTDRGVPLDLALPVARALMAHLARETGWGRNEWGHAPGNIKCRGSYAPEDERGWHGDCHWLTNRNDGRQLYRSYPNIREGLADYLRLMESRTYRGAWHHLLRHPEDGVGWYDRLMRAGYHPWSQEGLNEYRSIQRTITTTAQSAGSTGNAVPLSW